MTFWNDITSTYHKIENRAEHAVSDLKAEAGAAANKLSDEAHGLAKGLSVAASNSKRELTSIGHVIADTAVKAADTERKVDDIVNHESMLLGEGVATGAILNPVNALRQVSNHVFGTHINKIEFANQNEVDHSVAGVAGEVVGTVAAFIATDGAASALTGLSACSLGTMVIAGAVQGTALTPTKENVSGFRFLEQRAASGVIGAAASATMGFVAGKIGAALQGRVASEIIEFAEGGEKMDRTLPAAPKPVPIAHVVRHGFSNTVGGGLGGIVQSEGESLFDYGRLATLQELQAKIGMGAAGWTPPEGGFARLVV